MQSILTSSNRKFFRISFAVIVFFLFTSLSPVTAGNPAGTQQPVFHSLTTSAATPAQKTVTQGAKVTGLQTGAQEKLRALSSQLSQSGTQKSARVRRSLAATKPQNTKDLSLKAKGDDVLAWYGPDKYTPRQIKLKPEARKQGKVLMQAVSKGQSQRDRDEQTAREFLRVNGSALRITRPDEELTMVRYQQDELKRRHLRYQQQYKQIPIWPAEINVHLDALGNVDVVNGSQIPTPMKQVTKPVVSSEAALKRARQVVEGGKDAETTAPELIIFTDGGHSARLAWKIQLSVSYDAYWMVVVDALNGAVLNNFNQVNTALANGSGTDLFGVTRQLKLWSESGKYYLVDTSKAMYDATSDPPGINTTRGAIIIGDLAHTELPDQGSISFQLITSASATSGFLPDGVSLAYSLSQTYDYYKERHSRTSIDGKNSSMLGFTRVGTNFKNAFWTTEYNAMFFGDGKKYAGALDVVAHELTHGITSFTCNLVYQDQSGALNEAFSDIFGEMVEARTNGKTDWINGTLLNDGGRDLKNTHSLEISPGSGYYYPAKMSQFYARSSALLQQFVNQDNGGVHINCTIVSHAFYLLAEGLTGAIGNVDAAKIFHRAQTVHLLSGSQFIDARLACITSAEELFGQDSVQAQKTAEAFDAVEIFDNAETPTPPPTTPVSGTDSAVFIAYADYPYYDYYLAAYEGGSYWVTANPVALKRPSVSGDGTTAFYVDAYNDACFVNTDGYTTEVCLGFTGQISSVAMSPDQQLYGFVLLDEFGEPTNQIMVVDVGPNGETRTFTLAAPGTEFASVNTVLFADYMDFTSDNRFVIYDAFNVLTLPDNSQIGVWSIYALDLVTEQIIRLTEPVKDYEVYNPAVSQTTNHIITFEVYDENTKNSTVYAMNLLDGNGVGVAQITDGLAAPGYTGDDKGIVFAVPNTTTYTGYSLYKQTMQADYITPTTAARVAVFDTGDYGAAFGVVYRRGSYSAPVPNITTSANSLSYGTVNVGAKLTKALTVTNNGTGDLRIDSITLGGTNPGQFTLSGSCAGQIVSATGSCEMNVVFTPTSGGSKTASMVIKSDDPDTPSKTIALSGSGKTVIVDTDGDGMPDYWETLYGLNKNVNDANQDLDNDGFTNLQEFLANTLPNNPNSHPVDTISWLPGVLGLLLSDTSSGGIIPGTEEIEPNNTFATAQNIGNATVGSSFTITGRIASGGISGDTYTGDLDLSKFALPAQANISLSLDWTGTADLDLLLGTQNYFLELVNGNEKPIQLSGTVSPETFYVLLGSKNSAADYQLTITTTAGSASYANNNALLNGDYYESGSSLIYIYRFNGAGSYTYLTWNPLSGEYPYHSGAYEVWYPYLILKPSGDDSQVLDLRILSSSTIVIDDVNYSK